MRKTVVAVCLLLCLGIAHARLSAAPADEGNKKCNKPCADAYEQLTGKTVTNTRSQGQDKKDDKGNDNKGNDNKDNEKAQQKFCAGSSCSGCPDYAAICYALRCTGRPTTQEALNAVTKRSDITWDSCRFVRVGSECKSKCEDSCRAAGCSATTYRVACVQNAATKKAEWAKVITPTTQAACTLPTPPLRTCSGAPPGSATRSGVTTAYAWPAACKDLAVATPLLTCTGAASCPSSAVASATATCTEQGQNLAPAWVVTDACPAPIPTPQLCTAVPVLANTTFPTNCANSAATATCTATGCASGYTPFPTPVATCTAAGWTFNGTCVGPAALKLELVGTSPVATGATITLKATLTQANTIVGGRPVILLVTAGTNIPVSCTSAANTDASGVALFSCTGGPLPAPLINQTTPVATIVFIASVVPTFGTNVTSPPLNVAVAGALCGSFNGTNSTAYYEGFESGLSATSTTGITAAGPGPALQGNNLATIPVISGGAAGSLWGSPSPITFPAAGKLITQVAVYLDPTPAYPTSGLQFYYTVGLNKAGLSTSARDFSLSFGWYDVANSNLNPQKRTLWVTSGIVPDPKNSTSNKVPITEAGWYYLQVAFLREACGLNYPNGTQCVVAQMGLFKAFPGGSCGSLVATQNSAAVASWKVLPRPEVLPGFGVVSVSDRVENYGGPSPGIFATLVPFSVDAFSYTSFST